MRNIHRLYTSSCGKGRQSPQHAKLFYQKTLLTYCTMDSTISREEISIDSTYEEATIYFH